MIDFYEKISQNADKFRQLACKDALFLKYSCPLEILRQDMWSKHNYFLYVFSGKKTWYTPGRSWTLHRGEAIFVKKGACIVEQFPEEEFCVIVFFVPDEFMQALMRENSIVLPTIRMDEEASAPVIQLSVSPLMEVFYWSVLPYFSQTIIAESLLELKFRELLLNLLTDPNNKPLQAYVQGLKEQKVPSLRQIMEDNYLYNLEMKDFADLCNRSLSSFKRDFMATFGTTPGKWITERRLEHASRLLLSTQLSCNEVAFESGFENNTHFSRVFKDRFGMSPLLYRQQMQSFAVQSA